MDGKNGTGQDLVRDRTYTIQDVTGREESTT
jgi:hypothetical protein